MHRRAALFAMGLLGLAAPAQAAKLNGCSLDGKALHGRVQIVDSAPDFKVMTVTSFPDLLVQQVESFPDACGKWQIVDSFPDFKIEFVSSFPDFTIEYVTSFPGLPSGKD